MIAPMSVEETAAGRSKTLRQVILRGRDAGGKFAYFRQFMDEFYERADPAPRAEMLHDYAARIDDERVNAYFAAVAEYDAFRDRLAIPDWPQDGARFLKRPRFPRGLESLKAIALMESPTAFRRGTIFVGDDPMYRPHRDKSGIG